MQRRRFLRAVGLAGGLSVAGCLDSRAGASGDYDVGMSTTRFRPADLTVDAGTEVVWRNTSKQGHTVTAYEDRIPEDADFFASGGFDSQSAAESAWVGGGGGLLAAGDTFAHTFTVPGDYAYFCIPHESNGMVGTVVVEG